MDKAFLQRPQKRCFKHIEGVYIEIVQFCA